MRDFFGVIAGGDDGISGGRDDVIGCWSILLLLDSADGVGNERSDCDELEHSVC